MKTSSNNSIVRSIHKKFLLECRGADIEVIADRLRSLRKSEQASLLEYCSRILSDTRRSSNETTRVAYVKTLVALLPSSLDLLEKCLKTRRGKQAYEVHFTIFCFLDELNVMRASGKTKRRILDAVSEYLHSVRSESGNAAWMAGDLLGEHWKTYQTVEILLNTVQEGRYVAGRLGALHGLDERLRQRALSSSLAKSIFDVLEKVSHYDKSLRVRFYASHILRGRKLEEA